MPKLYARVRAWLFIDIDSYHPAALSRLDILDGLHAPVRPRNAI